MFSLIPRPDNLWCQLLCLRSFVARRFGAGETFLHLRNGHCSTLDAWARAAFKACLCFIDGDHLLDALGLTAATGYHIPPPELSTHFIFSTRSDAILKNTSAMSTPNAQHAPLMTLTTIPLITNIKRLPTVIPFFLKPSQTDIFQALLKFPVNVFRK